MQITEHKRYSNYYQALTFALFRKLVIYSLIQNPGSQGIRGSPANGVTEEVVAIAARAEPLNQLQGTEPLNFATGLNSFRRMPSAEANPPGALEEIALGLQFVSVGPEATLAKVVQMALMSTGCRERRNSQANRDLTPQGLQTWVFSLRSQRVLRCSHQYSVNT